MVALGAAALLVGSALLFIVQPMIGRMLLPLAGGAPAVWTTCLMFFQTGLLAGYLYAHLASRWLPARLQMIAHAVVLLLPLFVLRIGLGGSDPPDPANPVPWLLRHLTSSVGLPFVVIAANAPLVQRWFASTRHPAASDPYFLYAASNVGSFAGLVGYPVLIEPRLTLAHQSLAWTIGYALLVVLTFGVMAAAMWNRAPETAQAQAAAEDAPGADRWRWLALSFVTSTLMLSVTTYISTDIAAVPLLWVLPLGLYLVSLVLVFARRPLLPHGLMTTLLPVALIPAALTLLLKLELSPVVLVPIHLAALFVACMVAHGELVRARPAAGRLTSFYLWVAAGGAAGGVFGAIVAPQLFSTALEYPLALVLAALCRRPKPGATGRSLMDFTPIAVVALVVLQMIVARVAGRPPTAPGTVALIVVPAIVACAVAIPRSRAFAAGLAIVLASGIGWERWHARTELRERNFFGVLSVERSSGGRFRALIHGNTIHGTQALDPARRRQPTTYYARSGPAGDVLLEKLDDGSRVGVVGLGAGTLAAYASGSQRWTFYEINPAVIRIARDAGFFTYLPDCGAKCDVVAGDARLTLAPLPRGFDVLVLDAFNSDAIPVHLLTREALALYRRLLAPGGVILVHLSNRFLDLRPVVAALAADAGMVAVQRTDTDVDLASLAAGKFDSCWAALASSRDDLKGVATNPEWTPLGQEARIGVWTDDFSNVFALLLNGTGGPFARP